MYKWVIESLSEMEPKWSPSNIKKITFADDLVIQTLLDELNIQDLCTLRSDYYHLMNEVFTKEHNFGDIVYSKISKFPRCMLLSHTADEWKEAYAGASVILENMPPKIRK